MYTAFVQNQQSGEDVIAYVFQTSDLPPEEVRFSAPPDVLVGIDTNATITAIKVLDYRESFRSSRGDFMAARGF